MILFICTGNTCRSPLAEAIARSRGMEALSAGIYAQAGAPASREACLAAERRGLNLWSHRARMADEGLMEKAERIYAMTQGHALALLHRFPRFAGKLFVLQPEIPDPFGGDASIYEKCARQIERALENILQS